MDPTTWTVWEQLFRSFSEATSSDWTVKVAAAVVAALLIWVAERSWRYFGHLVLPRITEIWRSAGNIKRARSAVSKDGKGIWLADSIPINPPADYERKIRNSKPIICVANLKGGVGKTTTVANLVAHYGIKKNKRVLAIDLEPVRKFLESQESVVILSACARDSRGQACGTLKTGRGTNAKDVIRAT